MLESQSFTEDGRYQYVQDIGKGTFGCVVLARDVATGQLFAIKQMEREHVNRHYAGAEILNHAALHHPHIVAFRECFLTAHTVNIVMEYASGGSLLRHVQRNGPLAEPLARWFFQQLVLAVDYCHQKGVANRDIKLDNLLLQPVAGLARPLLKICDFGYSKSDSRSRVFSRVGTLNYMAPEVLHNTGGYDARAADVWSCGVCLYATLTGRFPYAAPSHDAPRPALVHGLVGMLRRMRRAELPLPEGLALSDCGAALLRRVLDPEPRRRASISDILQDPWFLTDLPPHALAMNSAYLRAGPTSVQPPDQIRAVVDALRASDSDDDSLDRLAPLPD